MGQYAFKGAFQGSGGFGFSEFNSNGNGMPIPYLTKPVPSKAQIQFG